jgi:hypothetical protein
MSDKRYPAVINPISSSAFSDTDPLLIGARRVEGMVPRREATDGYFGKRKLDAFLREFRKKAPGRSTGRLRRSESRIDVRSVSKKVGVLTKMKGLSGCSRMGRSHGRLERPKGG